MRKKIFSFLIVCLFISILVYINFDKLTLKKTEAFMGEKIDFLVNTPNKIFLVQKDNGGLSKKVIHNNKFMHTSFYNDEDGSIIAAAYSPENSFAGLTYFQSEKKPIDIDTEGFGPIHAVASVGLVFMDSSLSLSDSNGFPLTEMGLFDVKKEKFIDKFKVDGIVQYIIKTEDDEAIFSSFAGETNKSNIYKYSFKSKKVEKLLESNQASIPNKLEIYNNMLIGLSDTEAPGLEGDKNKLLVLEDGEVKREVKLKGGTIDFTVFNEMIFVIYETNGSSFIEAMDLTNDKLEKVSLAKNPTNIKRWGEYLIIIDSYKTLTLFDKELNKINELDLNPDSKVFDITIAH